MPRIRGSPSGWKILDRGDFWVLYKREKPLILIREESYPAVQITFLEMENREKAFVSKGYLKNDETSIGRNRATSIRSGRSAWDKANKLAFEWMEQANWD